MEPDPVRRHDVWRFLYKNRLPASRWAVLAQDRAMMEGMEPDAHPREMRHLHDKAIVRLRRHLRGLATRQIAELAAAQVPA